MAEARAAVVVKKYANRRLYDTESSTYITLDDLAFMVRAEREFVVYDARTGDDITRGVLTQIIMDEETRGRSILPTSFLRQLIGFYGGALQGIVPGYLEAMMAEFSARQAGGAEAPPRSFEARTFEARTFEAGLAGHPIDEAVAVIEHAARVLGPVLAASEVQKVEARLPTRDELQAEVAALKRELDAARQALHQQAGPPDCAQQ